MPSENQQQNQSIKRNHIVQVCFWDLTFGYVNYTQLTRPDTFSIT